MKYSLSEKLDELNTIFLSSKGNKIRYRIENKSDFTNDLLVNYDVNDEDITIEMENAIVTTHDATDVGITEYEERYDIWLYGKEYTNRFNVFK